MQIVKVSTGDRIRVTNFVPPSAGFGARVLTGEIRLVSSSKSRPGSSMELSAVDLSSHLLGRYLDQVYLWFQFGLCQECIRAGLALHSFLVRTNAGKLRIRLQAQPLL